MGVGVGVGGITSIVTAHEYNAIKILLDSR